MKNLDDLNYYEILQVPSGASGAEIEQAYEKALSIYAKDAPATYCLFTEEDRKEILELVEKAYQTLRDEDKRAAYSDELAASGRCNEPLVRTDQKKPSSPLLPTNFNREKHLADQNFDVQSPKRDAHWREIMHLLDICRKDIELLKKDRQGIKSRLKFLWMKEIITNKGILPGIEPQLLAISKDIEKSALRRQRKISIIIISYTLFAIAAFILLAATNAIMLPAFNVPYSVLLMGLVGCIFSMWLRLPNIRSEPSLHYDLTVWFIIFPPVAVIAAGLFFGIAQILLSLFQIELPDESWILWILAFFVGFVNWVYFYESFRGGFSKRGRKKHKDSLKSPGEKS